MWRFAGTANIVISVTIAGPGHMGIPETSMPNHQDAPTTRTQAYGELRKGFCTLIVSTGSRNFSAVVLFSITRTVGFDYASLGDRLHGIRTYDFMRINDRFDA